MKESSGNEHVSHTQYGHWLSIIWGRGRRKGIKGGCQQALGKEEFSELYYDKSSAKERNGTE